MSVLNLTKKEKEQIITSNHSAPRSVLGFHEVQKSDKSRVWAIRVLEPDAKQIQLYWEDQFPEDAVTLKKIHDGGLFEIVMPPRANYHPYRLLITYPDGHLLDKVDPFYFAPQITDYDRYLFNQGNHHRIYRKLGAHLLSLEGVSGTLFSVWAPNAKRVSLVGNFNLWDGRKHPMHLLEFSGIWELFVPEVAAGELYKYEIKTQKGELLLKSDPYGFAQEYRPATASKVVDLRNFAWQDQAWLDKRAKSNPLQEAINIYELHLGSWRNMDGAEHRFITFVEAAEILIPYVKDLGFTHIELMPLAEHPFDGSWGYQVTAYYAVTSRYGTPQDFMHFVNCCHAAGIGVIMDWVPGHFPKDAHGLSYFDGTQLYEHADPRQGEHQEWGTLIFNYGRHEVRNFLISNLLFWFEYYHIDGIRVDAVASMLYLDYNRNANEWVPNKYGGNQNLDAVSFLRAMNETLFHYYPGVLSIAEESTSWAGVSKPPYTGGLGFNFKWNMGWMNDTLRYFAKDCIYRQYDHHLLTFSLMYAFSENFILALSHDEVVHGKRSMIDKMPGDFWQKMANLRLLLCFQIGHPGKKLNFMGYELGQWREWAESRSLDWHLLDQGHRPLWHFVKQLNHFYLHHPALFTNDFDWSGFQWLDLNNGMISVLSFIRKDSTGRESPLIIILNLTPVPRPHYRAGLPTAGVYHKLFDSDETQFNGSGYNQQVELYSEDIPWQDQPYSTCIHLPPLGAIFCQKV